MPLYEYECDACGQRFELIQKFSDVPPDVCEKCGKGPVRRLLSSPAIQFKGSGWYITDYAQKGRTDSGKTDSGGGAAGKSDSTQKPAQGDAGSKSDGTTEKKSDAASTPATPPTAKT